jgi:diguanylate cyclase (GGDEF)-like protein/PAS domain S-box-containing protein
LERLSERELEVVQQLVDGRSYADGATALYISKNTFRTHVKNVLAKLSVHSSLELVSVAVEAGMRPRRTGTAIDPHADSEVLASVAFRLAPEGLVVLDAGGRVVEANPALADLLGLSPSDVVGVALEDHLAPGEAEHWRAAYQELLSGAARSGRLERRCRLHDTDDRWVEVSASLLPSPTAAGGVVVAVMHDVTRARRQEERLRWAATHDELTGVASRAMGMEHLEHALAHVARGGGAAGLLFIDLDDFKEVNDRWGHSTGDAVLKDVAQRVLAVIRPTDALCRFGGDEFVLCVDVLAGSPGTVRHELESMAARVLDAISGLGVGGVVGLQVTASIGVVGTRRADLRPAELLALADAAAYEAKRRGGGVIATSWIPEAEPSEARSDAAPAVDLAVG